MIGSLSKRVLARASLIMRRDVLRDPFLLEVRRWFYDRGDETLRLDYDLDADSTVLDLGGYHGDFAAAMMDRYACRVFVFEPLPAFYELCRERFRDVETVTCLPYGLSNRTVMMPISLDANASSTFAASRREVETTDIQLRAVDEAWSELGLKTVDLCKINIEGGEFDVLDRLIETGLVTRIRNLQVQFHAFVPDAGARREAIAAQLSNTHSRVWNYEFVWESWQRK